MKLSRILGILLSSLATESRADYVIHERRDEPSRVESLRARVRSSTVFPMRIALHPNNHARSNAETWLRAVSDPESASFGQFWTEGDVHEAFRPADESVEAVKSWLSRRGIHEHTHSDNKQWLAFDVSAEDAEALLQTEYFEQVLPDGSVQVSCDHYSLPEELQKHVDFVKPGVKDSTTSKRPLRRSNANIKTRNTKRDFPPLPPPFPKHPPKNPNSLENCDREATPACIRALYDIDVPDPKKPVSRNNSLGIFESYDLYYQADLNNFYEALTDIPLGTTPIDLLIDGAPPPPSGPNDKTFGVVTGESNLDLMTALPLIYPQNATIFQTDDLYYEAHIAYGSHGLRLFDDFLDAIDGSYCTYESGNDPERDPVYPDPHPGGYKGQLQCGVYKPTNVISISWGGAESITPVKYQERQCNEFLKLALRGVSVFFDSGDYGSSCEIQKTTDGERQLYVAQDPASCPWVTAVGGTQIDKGKTVDDPETAAELDWANINSGGGFSNIYERPWYQKTAVEQYFKASNNLSDIPYYRHGKYRNSMGTYNRDGRGVPDVSALASNIAVWLRGNYTGLSGTSASTPIVAAMFNRIIEERIRTGKGPLGLVNPTIYKHPEVWTDVVKGFNGYCTNDFGNFTTLYGAQYGYNCTEGWDPVTGMGTPKYPELLKVFMDLP